MVRLPISVLDPPTLDAHCPYMKDGPSMLNQNHVMGT